MPESGRESVLLSDTRRTLTAPAATCSSESQLACAMPLPQLLSMLESLDEFRELLSELPGPASRSGLGCLHGSSDAVVVASLPKNLTPSFFVVLNDDVD